MIMIFKKKWKKRGVRKMDINQKNDIPETFILKEIDLVQSCINRMAANSFDIKKWSVGIIAILAGLLKQNMLSHN